VHNNFKPAGTILRRLKLGVEYQVYSAIKEYKYVSTPAPAAEALFSELVSHFITMYSYYFDVLLTSYAFYPKFPADLRCRLSMIVSHFP